MNAVLHTSIVKEQFVQVPSTGTRTSTIVPSTGTRTSTIVPVHGTSISSSTLLDSFSIVKEQPVPVPVW